MNKNSESKLVRTDAKQVSLTTRYRSNVTEAEFYRPLSSLYDEVEENASKKKLKAFAWSLTTTGASHLFASVITEIPDHAFLPQIYLQWLYTIGSAVLLVAGLVMLAISEFFPRNRSKAKEAILKKYIDREFRDESLMTDADDRHSATISNKSHDIT